MWPLPAHRPFRAMGGPCYNPRMFSAARLLLPLGCALLCASLIAGVLCGEEPRPGIEVIDQMKRSVLAIAVAPIGKDGAVDFKQLVTVATAFLLSSDGSFATADHVLRDLEAYRTKRPSQQVVLLPSAGKWPSGPNPVATRYCLFDVVKRDQISDIAICRVVRDPENDAAVARMHPVDLQTEVPPDGTEVRFLGFAEKSALPLVGAGLIASYQMDEQLLRPNIVLHATGIGGWSGSPVFLASGKVIGVFCTSTGEKEEAGLSGVRPAQLVVNALRPK